MSDRTLLGVNVSSVDTSKAFALGTKEVVGGNEYVYCSFAAAEGQYEAVGINEDFAAESLTTTLAGAVPMAVGVVQVATSAASYAWVLIRGIGRVLVAASCAKDVVLYTTATAGVLDDASTTKVVGIRVDTTVTSAADSPCSLVTYPYCN